MRLFLTTTARPSRRGVRAVAAVAVCGVVLAACSSDGGVAEEVASQLPQDAAEDMAEGMADDMADDMVDGGTSLPNTDATTTTSTGTTGGTTADKVSGDELRALAGELVDDAIMFEPTEPEPVPTAPVVINPFEDAAADALSTFALDVDTASWTQTMFWLENGQRPPMGIVRPEEFMNWFDYGYEAPDSGWAIATDGAAITPWNPETSLLRVGLTTADIDPDDRPDATMTFVVDTSGSMQGVPLATVKETLLTLVDQLRPADRIGLVEYGSTARVLLEPTALSEERALRDAIEGLETNGSTYAEEGLRVGYELATRNLTPNGINVVVLASDGVANVGLTDAEGILKTIDEGVASGINLLALGISDGDFNDHLMEQLANRGNGSAYFVRDVADARRLFVDNLEQTFVVVAKDSKVQVEFDSATVASYRLIGYENRNVADDDFRNDAVDAGEVGAGHEVTALYELILASGASADDELATVRLRWEDPQTREVSEVSSRVRVSDLVPDADTRFGTAVQAAALAELLRGSPYVDVSLDAVAEFAAWGTSDEARDAIEAAAAANPPPGG